MEYTKQLLLSCLLNVCHRLSPDGGAMAAGWCMLRTRGSATHNLCFLTHHVILSADVLDEEKFSVELVVQCIRASDVPQTHHHALLLLGSAATIFPVSSTHTTWSYFHRGGVKSWLLFLFVLQEKVLHNIMPIFTFMGANLLRLDDAYSFRVIDKTVQLVIPALIQVSPS